MGMTFSDAGIKYITNKEYSGERQENLMTLLYDHIVSCNHSPGTFREKLEDGLREGEWNFEDLQDLERKSLISFDSQLLQAGVICIDITDSGRKYMEEEFYSSTTKLETKN